MYKTHESIACPSFIVTWKCKDVNLEMPLSPEAEGIFTRSFKLTNTVDDHHFG